MNRLNPWRWIALIIIAGSLLLQWYAHSCGFLLTHDSYNYLSAAKSFRESGQFLNTKGALYVYWPPLFPVLLSVFADPLKVMMWINLLLAAATGWMLASRAEKMIQHIGLRTIYLVSLLCGVHLIMDSVFLWSDLIFILLSLLFLFYFQKYKDSKQAIILSVVFGFLLCLQRNVGLYIVSGATLWYVLDDLSAWRDKIIRAICFFVITTSGFWIWNVSIALFFTSPLKVHEEEFFLHMGYNLNAMSVALLRAYLPLSVAGALVMIIVLAGLFIILKKEFKNNSMLGLMSCITLAYVAGMTVLFRIEYASDHDRYISVILPFFGLIVFSALDKLLTNRTYVIKTITMILLGLWLSYPMSRTIKNVKQWHDISCAR